MRLGPVPDCVAAAVSFTGILSFVEMVSVILVLLSVCPRDRPVKRDTSSIERIMPFLFNNMPPIYFHFSAIGFSSFAYNTPCVTFSFISFSHVPSINNYAIQ